MSKRPRRRRVKRSATGRDRQRRQLLTKKLRELYTPGSDDDPDAAWRAGLELDVRPRRRSQEALAASLPSAKPSDRSAASAERRGRIVAVSSGACTVETDGRNFFDCVLPSDLARDQRAAVAAGDEVVFTAHGAGVYRVRRVLDRRTTLSRPDPHNPHLERVIAANIDVAVHIASVVEPPLRPALIDRYLIAIGRGGAKALVCVNKIDLLDDDAARRRELERLDPYRRLGIEIVPTSAVTGEGLEELANLLADKTAVFVGHSGVGKSSLANALDPSLDAATAATSTRGGKGRHTTTRSSLYRLAGGVRVIDTPGIREFGLWRLTPGELRACFPDFDRLAAGCRFNDCSHSHEPDCGVRRAVGEGKLARARYETYLRILAELASQRDETA